jgi:hypothetical protein
LCFTDIPFGVATGENMVRTLIYYVISPVHVRNVQVLAPHLAQWTIRIAYEKDGPWLNSKNLGGFCQEAIAFGPGKIPEALWADNVEAVIFSTAQPRQAPLELLSAAIERGIPTIAIEESNQIALNQGRVNNYVLPVDRVLVASPHESRGMAGAGFPKERFVVTGWPFYAGPMGPTNDEGKLQAKKELGLDIDRPVAALTLTGLHDAGESSSVRKRQLRLAASGLPEEYQLAIKPHPIESLDTLMPFVTECAPNAVVIEGMVKVDKLLEAADVLLNRGVSQVCIEALFNYVPVIVLDTGITTPFHGVVDQVIAKSEADIKEILGRIERNKKWQDLYLPFYDEHIPYQPHEACLMTCKSIEEIAIGGECDLDQDLRWFDLALCFAWSGDRKNAAKIVERNCRTSSGIPHREFIELIELQASRDDLDILKKYLGEGLRSQFLRCLWIDQLDRRTMRPQNADWEWMADFPKQLDAVWFVPHFRCWVFLLLRFDHNNLVVALVERMVQGYIHVPGVEQLMSEVEDYLSGAVGRVRVILKDRVRKVLQPVGQWLHGRLG